jgi:hypothetical protein
MDKEGNRKARQRIISPDMIFKLSWTPRNSASCCVYIYISYVYVVGRMGGAGGNRFLLELIKVKIRNKGTLFLVVFPYLVL